MLAENTKESTHEHLRNTFQWIANSSTPVQIFLLKELSTNHIINILANVSHITSKTRLILKMELSGRRDGVYSHVDDLNKLTRRIDAQEIASDEIRVLNRLKYAPIDTSKIGYTTVGGVNMTDYPDFADAYFTYAEWTDGTPLTEEELHQLETEHYGFLYDTILNSIL